VSAFFRSGLFFGLIDLAVLIDQTPGSYDSYLLETGWGVLCTFLVGAAFISLTMRPEMAMPVVSERRVAWSPLWIVRGSVSTVRDVGDCE
jgi:hypothetical protein